MAQSLEVMVVVNVPATYASWPREAQLARQERVLRWYDYVLALNRKGRAPWIWGSHQIIDAVAMSEAQCALVVIYRVRSLAEFDVILLNDPLRDMSSYLTVPLQPLSEDIVSDIKRAEASETQQKTNSPLESVIQTSYRSLFRSPPDYFDPAALTKLKYPPNPKTNVRYREKSNDPIQLLLYGINPDELIGVWNDARRAIHHEKVLWWHAYVDKLTRERRMSHCWSTHDFCALAGGPPSKTAGGVLVLRAPTFDDLNSFYQENPLRDEGRFLSIFLRPIADQRAADERKLRLLSDRTSRR